MEHNILFKCPRTGINVQHLVAEQAPRVVETYESVLCPACASLHFVNTVTGKLLGEQSEGAASSGPCSKRPQCAT